jgi:hypothetical protein
MRRPVGAFSIDGPPIRIPRHGFFGRATRDLSVNDRPVIA